MDPKLKFIVGWVGAAIVAPATGLVPLVADMGVRLAPRLDAPVDVVVRVVLAAVGVGVVLIIAARTWCWHKRTHNVRVSICCDSFMRVVIIFLYGI